MLSFPKMKPLDSDKKVEKAVETPVEAAPVVEEKIDFSNVVIEPLFEDFVDFETFSKSDFRAVKVLDEEAVPMPKDFDIAEYTNGMLRMYNSERCDVELICDNSVMDAIIDKFGTEAKTYAYDMTSFRLEVNVAVNHVFLSWYLDLAERLR